MLSVDARIVGNVSDVSLRHNRSILEKYRALRPPDVLCFNEVTLRMYFGSVMRLN